MPRDPRACLYDILDACRFLRGFVRGRTYREYLADRGFRSAVERELQNIGEAMFQINKHTPELAARITDAPRIIGLRHILVHDYHRLAPDILWFVVEQKIEPLESEVSALLASFEGPLT